MSKSHLTFSSEFGGVFSFPQCQGVHFTASFNFCSGHPFSSWTQRLCCACVPVCSELFPSRCSPRTRPRRRPLPHSPCDVITVGSPLSDPPGGGAGIPSGEGPMWVLVTMIGAGEGPCAFAITPPRWLGSQISPPSRISL